MSVIMVNNYGCICHSVGSHLFAYEFLHAMSSSYCISPWIIPFPHIMLTLHKYTRLSSLHCYYIYYGILLHATTRYYPSASLFLVSSRYCTSCETPYPILTPHYPSPHLSLPIPCVAITHYFAPLSPNLPRFSLLGWPTRGHISNPWHETYKLFKNVFIRRSWTGRNERFQAKWRVRSAAPASPARYCGNSLSWQERNDAVAYQDSSRSHALFKGFRKSFLFLLTQGPCLVPGEPSQEARRRRHTTICSNLIFQDLSPANPDTDLF